MSLYLHGAQNMLVMISGTAKVSDNRRGCLQEYDESELLPLALLLTVTAIK